MKKKKARKILGLLIFIMIIFIGGLGIFAINTAPLDRNNTSHTMIKINEGDTTTDISNTLVEKKIIKSKSAFKFFSKISGYDSKYKPGVYSLSPSMSLNQVAKTIVLGKSKNYLFTIPEGYTIKQTAELLSEQGIVSKDKFLDTARNNKFQEFSFLKSAQSGENHLEGYLFPNTYSVSIDADEEQILTTMLDEFNSKFTPEFKKRAKEMGYSINDIIIIASIIERESQTPEDRAKISSVIYNRLKINMPLQMCSTVQYILGKQKPILSIKDTQIDSPYNTYLHKGLPKGPICSPGEASIKAALYPAKTDYLYFVVSEKLDGSHNFSKDFDKFEKDSKAYQEALKKKNKK